MKSLKEIHDHKTALTAKTSDVMRQLAFAGIAVIWVLRANGTEGIVPELKVPLALFALTLFLDVLQYALGSLVWIVFYNFHFEKEESDDAKIDIPSWINWPTYGCFWLRFLVLVVAWSVLVEHLVKAWKL